MQQLSLWRRTAQKTKARALLNKIFVNNPDGGMYVEIHNDHLERNADCWLSRECLEAACAGFHNYDAESWLQTIRFKLMDFAQMPFAMCMIFATFLMLAPSIRSYLEALPFVMDAHAQVGSALSILLVVRTDSSYKRWWEARCALQGIINSCRSHATSVGSMLRSSKAIETNYMWLILFFMTVKTQLRGEAIRREELGGRLPWSVILKVNEAPCPPMYVLQQIHKLVHTNLPEQNPEATGDETQINAAIFMESADITTQLAADFGACERIRTTPLSHGYVTALRTVIVIWLSTLPLVMIPAYGWITVPVYALISFVFLSIESIAVEIEDPFGVDRNDLPIERYIMELEKTMLQLLHLQTDSENERHLAGDIDNAGVTGGGRKKAA